MEAGAETRDRHGAKMEARKEGREATSGKREQELEQVAMEDRCDEMDGVIRINTRRDMMER